MWKIKNEKRIYTNEEVISFIETLPNKAIFLSGPTKSGKTPLIKSVHTDKKLIISSETFVEIIIGMCKNKEISALEELMSVFEPYSLLCIEDADIKLSGRESAQEIVSYFLEGFLERSTVVFTGVNLDNNLIKLTEILGTDKIVIFKNVDKFTD